MSIKSDRWRRLLASLALMMLVLPMTGSNAWAQSISPESVTATTYRIHFQGRLLTPGTGAPKPDGVYPITFALYDVISGGAALWSETKNVTTSNGGMFSTLLGDTTPLVLANFNGQDLWLGIKVSADAEATPRQRIAYTPYALYATSAGNAATLGGSAPNDFAAASHTHAGSAITSGTVDEARIDGALARDSEVGALASTSDLMAPKTHSHLGDTWSGTDTFLKIEGATGVAPLIISNSVFGNAIQASSVGPAVQTTSSGADGFYVTSAADDGLQVTSANFGVYVVNATFQGVLIADAGAYGVRINDSASGIYVGASETTYIMEAVDTAAFNTRFTVERTTGHVRADGSFLPGGADFAEMLPAVDGLTPGDVLVIGSDGKLTRSTSANATNLAGVFSTKPGVVGGLPEADGVSSASIDPVVDAKLAGEPLPAANVVKAQGVRESMDPIAAAYVDGGLIPLAVTGVVPVKASAENGAIQPGDLLTTAATPGRAMKASPVDIGGVSIYRPGTILGKALEPLAAGSGTISVLLVQQ